MAALYKDESLAALAALRVNVAMFASFDPQGRSLFSRIFGRPADDPNYTPRTAAQALINAGAEGVNIRTFLPDKPEGNPFFYGPDHGFDDLDRVAEVAGQMMAQGYHIILNETVDINDGGVSGVLYRGLLAFGPKATPRVVEQPDAAVLQEDLGRRLLEVVYGVRLSLPHFGPSHRVELSIHPKPRGWLRAPYLVWQAEYLPGADALAVPGPRWPNRFSEAIGDKAYGLLVADMLGYPVPYTTVVSREISLFSFGRHISDRSGGIFMRTAPRRQQPGKFTTSQRHLDAFAVMAEEDPRGTEIAAMLWQEGVTAKFSGACLTDAEGLPVIEGLACTGEDFMLGAAGPDTLPEAVVAAVRERWAELCAGIGPVRFEWAWDGLTVWVLQLHAGQSQSHGQVIVDGEPEFGWRDIVFTGDLEELRAAVDAAAEDGYGLRIAGRFGLTAHPSDICRRARVPAVMV